MSTGVQQAYYGAYRHGRLADRLERGSEPGVWRKRHFPLSGRRHSTLDELYLRRWVLQGQGIAFAKRRLKPSRGGCTHFPVRSDSVAIHVIGNGDVPRRVLTRAAAVLAQR